MSVEENKKSIRRVWEEALNKGNMALINELVVPDFVLHSTPERKVVLAKK
jgi:hypothetical protein